jgi:hypothetical protein
VDKAALNCWSCGRFGPKTRRTWITLDQEILVICDRCWEEWLTPLGREVLMDPKKQWVPVERR